MPIADQVTTSMVRVARGQHPCYDFPPTVVSVFPPSLRVHFTSCTRTGGDGTSISGLRKSATAPSVNCVQRKSHFQTGSLILPKMGASGSEFPGLQMCKFDFQKLSQFETEVKACANLSLKEFTIDEFLKNSKYCAFSFLFHGVVSFTPPVRPIWPWP